MVEKDDDHNGDDALDSLDMALHDEALACGLVTCRATRNWEMGGNDPSYQNRKMMEAGARRCAARQ